MGPRNRRVEPATKSSAFQAQLLDIDAVALALGVTRRHVQRLVAERRIPFLKIGRFVRFDPSELNVWLEERRVDVVEPKGLPVQPPGNVKCDRWPGASPQQ